MSDVLSDMLGGGQSSRLAGVAAEFDRRGARIAELEAEVARLSRRPDLTPEQCGLLANYFPLRTDEAHVILDALRTASDREAMER